MAFTGPIPTYLAEGMNFEEHDQQLGHLLDEFTGLSMELNIDNSDTPMTPPPQYHEATSGGVPLKFHPFFEAGPETILQEGNTTIGRAESLIILMLAQEHRFMALSDEKRNEFVRRLRGIPGLKGLDLNHLWVYYHIQFQLRRHGTYDHAIKDLKGTEPTQPYIFAHQDIDWTVGSPQGASYELVRLYEHFFESCPQEDGRKIQGEALARLKQLYAQPGPRFRLKEIFCDYPLRHHVRRKLSFAPNKYTLPLTLRWLQAMVDFDMYRECEPPKAKEHVFSAMETGSSIEVVPPPARISHPGRGSFRASASSKGQSKGKGKAPIRPPPSSPSSNLQSLASKQAAPPTSTLSPPIASSFRATSAANMAPVNADRQDLDSTEMDWSSFSTWNPLPAPFVPFKDLDLPEVHTEFEINEANASDMWNRNQNIMTRLGFESAKRQADFQQQVFIHQQNRVQERLDAHLCQQRRQGQQCQQIRQERERRQLEAAHRRQLELHRRMLEEQKNRQRPSNFKYPEELALENQSRIQEVPRWQLQMRQAERAYGIEVLNEMRAVNRDALSQRDAQRLHACNEQYLLDNQKILKQQKKDLLQRESDAHCALLCSTVERMASEELKANPEIVGQVKKFLDEVETDDEDFSDVLRLVRKGKTTEVGTDQDQISPRHSNSTSTSTMAAPGPVDPPISQAQTCWMAPNLMTGCAGEHPELNKIWEDFFCSFNPPGSQGGADAESTTNSDGYMDLDTSAFPSAMLHHMPRLE